MKRAHRLAFLALALAPVTALGWDAAGSLLAFGTETGDAGVIDLG